LLILLKIIIMKYFYTAFFSVLMVFNIAFLHSQEKKILFEKKGKTVIVKTYHDNGILAQQGMLKNNKLEGEWIAFNSKGEKTMIGYYSDGVKTGKWFFWNENSLREVNFENNKINNIIVWEKDKEIAYGK